MKTIIAILAIVLVTGSIYHLMLVGEYQSELRVQKALNKACEADRMWKQIQLNEKTYE